MIDYTYNAGMALADNFAEAIILAKLNNEPVKLCFDGQEFTVEPGSTVRALLQEFMAMKPRQNPTNARQPYADT